MMNTLVQLQELAPEENSVHLEFCCPVPKISTFMTCLGCTFTR